MKDKKKKFSSQKELLILLQQLQVKYFGNENAVLDIDMIAGTSIGVWLRKGERITSIVFSDTATGEERERRYNELLTLIDDRL